MAALDTSQTGGKTGPNDAVPVESYLCEEESDCVIIHEVFDSQTPLERGERELDKAMVSKHSTIVIEPHQLGEECVRYIRVGNALHKASVLAGLTALGVSTFRGKWSVPFCGMSLGTAAVYHFSWQHDPCCKYQVDSAGHYLHRIPLDQLSSAAPVILVRRDDVVRKKLHNTVAAAAALLLVFQIVNIVRKL